MKNWKKTLGAGMLALSLMMTYASANSPTSFKDIGNHWSKSTIEWADQRGMVKGYPDGTFKPDGYVTEAELLAVLIRGFNSSVEQKGVKHWADSFYSFAKAMNYPTAGQANTQKRDYKIARLQVAEIIAGSQGVNYKGDDAIKYLLVKGIAQGKTSATVSGYKGGDFLTRAEVIQFVKNVKETGMEEIKARPLTPSDSSSLDQQYHDFLKKQQPELNPEVQMELARNDVKLEPELGLTQEHLTKWTNVMYEVGKKSRVVNGKIRIYLPQNIPDDHYIAVELSNSKANKVYFGKPHGKEVPEFVEFPKDSPVWGFNIVLEIRVGKTGALPFAYTDYWSDLKSLYVNGIKIEENVIKE